MPDPQRRRILIITRNLPPLVGGMERLNWHMAEELAKVADVRVIGPSGAAAQAPRGAVIQDAPLKPLPRFLLSAQWKAWRLARHWRPHVVLAGSGLTAPLAWSVARLCGACCAVYVHGLDIAVEHPLYRALWLPAIRGMDRVIANSRATQKLATDAGVKAECIGIVHPGVDIPVDDDNGRGAADFRAKHQLGRRPVLLSVGRLSQRKGLREFVTGVLPRVVEAQPDVVLLIIGDAPNQALNSPAQSRESIQDAADRNGVSKNIRFLGLISDSDLACAFNAGDVHAFPVQHIPGDPEGFGMVAIEAAAHGLPTVAYATGGTVDAVAEGRSGHLIAAGDEAGMAAAIINTLARRDAMRASCKAFAAAKAWPLFGEQIARNLFAPESLDVSTSPKRVQA